MLNIFFNNMSQVARKKRQLVNTSYQASNDQIGVSITSPYNKSNWIEPHTSAELARDAWVAGRNFYKLGLTLSGNIKKSGNIKNIPENGVSTMTIADVYPRRWTNGTVFQYLADYLNSRINALGFPRAALFEFFSLTAAHMVIATVKVALFNATRC